MASLNKVMLIGNLGKDPETRFMADGKAVCNFSIATSESWKGADGQKQERTEWHNITVYGKLAEICGQYLKKGSSAYFEGKLHTRKWTDKQGIEKYTTEIIVDQMTMLGGGERQESRPADKAAPARAAKSDGDFDEDSIPF